MAIRAVIFDAGGVLIRTADWSGRRAWEARLGLPERGLSQAVFDCDVAIRGSMGQATDADIWNDVASRLKLDAEQLKQLQIDFWAGDCVNTELVQFIQGLRPRCKVAILSNAWPGWRDTHARVYGLDKVADTIVYSFEVGVTKPDPRMYFAALERLGVRPDEAVFVDDFAENVEGARAIGMQAVHFRDTAEAIAELTRILEL
jgi:epoxide hydrolase-like predicted phosphatase